MTEPTIRIYRRMPDGSVHDGEEDYDRSAFAGQIPSIGDLILNPGVLTGVDRRQAQNREIWEVVGRIFNPRDLEDYIALVVETHSATDKDAGLI